MSTKEPHAPTMPMPASADDTAASNLNHGSDDADHAGSNLVGSGDALVPAAAHDIGDIVASIAAFDPANPLESLDQAHLAQDLAHHDAASSPVASGEGAAGDAMHGGTVDLSDVGSVLSHASSDVAWSNFDLDHLTNSLNLFDFDHVDTGADGSHHS